MLSLATLTVARGTLFERTIVANGGWSLSMPVGSTCPDQTATCFSNLTGVSETFDRTGVSGTFDRGQECCPSGTTPRLDCGTYVNIGQPYACCPLGKSLSKFGIKYMLIMYRQCGLSRRRGGSYP
jgi:hypothetical protein